MIEVADVQDSQNPIAFPEMRKLNDGFGLQSIPLTRQMRRESLEDPVGTVWAGLLDSSLGTHAGRLCAIQNGSTKCYGEKRAFVLA